MIAAAGYVQKPSDELNVASDAIHTVTAGRYIPGENLASESAVITVVITTESFGASSPDPAGVQAGGSGVGGGGGSRRSGGDGGVCAHAASGKKITAPEITAAAIIRTLLAAVDLIITAPCSGRSERTPTTVALCSSYSADAVDVTTAVS